MPSERSRSRSPVRSHRRSRSPRDRERERKRSRSPERRQRDRYESPPRKRRIRDDEDARTNRDRRSQSPDRRDRRKDREHGGKRRKMTKEPKIDLESVAAVDDDLLKQMGFGGFDSTKGKKVEGNISVVAKVNKPRKYRQYMNRKGGFNRPLDFIA